MDILEKKEYYSMLFDCYETLLTNKQVEYFRAYYFEDWSLSEIASSHNVSRNAVFDSIKKVYQLLEDYEEKLQLNQKRKQREELYSELEKLDSSSAMSIIEKLKQIE